jgi:hypothetical protein
MKKIFIMLGFLSLVVLMDSCKTPKDSAKNTVDKKPENFQPYTEGLKKKYKITDEEEKRIQFYNGTEFSLNLTVDSVAKSINNSIVGEKITINDKIVFPSRKPGILLSKDRGALWIQFEPGSKKDIPFKSGISGYTFSDSKVSYSGRVYTASNVGSVLLVNIEELEKVINSSREVPGMTIDEAGGYELQPPASGLPADTVVKKKTDPPKQDRSEERKKSKSDLFK